MSAERARRPPSAEGALARDQRRGVEAAEAERGELAPLPPRMLSLRAPAMSLIDQCSHGVGQRLSLLVMLVQALR